MRKALRIASSVLGAALCLLLLPVLIFNMILAINTYAKPEELPMAFGIAPLVVNSGSMQPAIGVEDLIFIKACDASTLQVNDIATYISDNGSAVTHRVMAIDTSDEGERLFLFKGDFNNVIDQKQIKASQIAGVYMGRLEGGGKFANFLKSVPGLILCVGVPIALYLAWNALRKVLLKNKKKREAAALPAAE